MKKIFCALAFFLFHSISAYAFDAHFQIKGYKNTSADETSKVIIKADTAEGVLKYGYHKLYNVDFELIVNGATLLFTSSQALIKKNEYVLKGVIQGTILTQKSKVEVKSVKPDQVYFINLNTMLMTCPDSVVSYNGHMYKRPSLIIDLKSKELKWIPTKGDKIKIVRFK